ncbi:MAG: S9 family peptidase [Bacteroidales bacterium]|nr:S9 family peptidase [Bacteroidales bacterium]
MKPVNLIVMAIAAVAALSCGTSYPKAPKDGTVDTYFGTEVQDPFRPLEDEVAPATISWIKAENRLTDSYFRKLKERGPIFDRLMEVSNYEKVGLPSRRPNGKWYFYRNDGLQNQSVLYEADSPEGPGRVFLDPNALSEDGTVALKGAWFSRDCRYLAYAVSRSGSDWQEFYVMDVESRKLLDDHIEWSKFSEAAWQGDGFYYGAYDPPVEGREFSSVNETHKIYYHKIGTPQSEDKLYYSNPDYPKRFYQVSTNEEETMMFLYEDGERNGNNLYVRDLTKKDAPWVQMTPDMESRVGVAETDGTTIYILTNNGAPCNRLVAADIAHPEWNHWKDIVPETDAVLEDASFVGDKIILEYSRDAYTHAYICNRDGSDRKEITLPGIGTAGFNGKKDEPWCFFSFSSFTVPAAIYSFNIETLESTLFRNPETKFDLSGLETRQVFFPSKDGTMVPMFITCRKDAPLDGSNTVLLYGYGGFAISMPPYFSATRVPFLERGGIYVQVNLRGGSEYGEKWHEAGTKMQKENVFDDFIAAAEWLIANGYTSKEKLAIMGGSNGGLLVGACMTKRPDLFAVAVPQVGVMDMLRYHKFTIGWNWAPDYGTSEDSEEMFRYLLGYSPLHNLKEGVNYPATLVTTADHDDRVVPAHSFKFAARLQECTTGERPALIRIDTKSGHGGGKPLSKVLEEQADIYAFIIHNTGM